MSQHSPPREVGLIGLGLLGSALAERLLGQGFSIRGHDVEPERLAALIKLGGNAVAEASHVAANCERIILCLPTSEVVDRVLAILADSLRPGTILLDATTGPPADAQRGGQLAKRGIDYLEATVSGSSEQARQGAVALMCGGAKAAFDACSELLQALAERVFYVGPCGAGSQMKLVTNLVLGLNRAALAEGLGLAAAYGLELSQALEVLRAGAAYSRAMDAKGEKMIARDYAPQARLAQHLKDVRLMLESGEAAGARLPFSQLHRELLETLVAAGLAVQDNSAIFAAFDVAGKDRAVSDEH